MIFQMKVQDCLTRKLREKMSTTLNNKTCLNLVLMIHLGTIKLLRAKIPKLREFTSTKLMQDRSKIINTEL